MERKIPDISSAGLHILAMFFMLLDHMWATVTPGNEWMTCLGRIAFPIFAFMIVEGYFHTHDLKKYLLRLLICAVLSEIPMNLMYGAQIIYPYHQNVIWTFLIGLCLIIGIDWLKKKGKLWLTILGGVLMTIAAVIIGLVSFVDYYESGVLIVLMFYLFHGRKWWCYLGQFLVMAWINLEYLGGFYYPVTILGHEIELLRQGFAMLALIPIWLYKGRQGYHSKAFQLVCYGFYPVHMLVLSLIMLQ